MTKNQLPRIAVIIPAYRVAPYIRAVIEEVPAFVAHIVVVDDASPDDLQQVLAEIPDNRIHMVRHEANRGVGAAVMTGNEVAMGLGGEIMTRLGASVQVLGGPEIYPALERGAIDATEFVGPYDDEKLGFHEIARGFDYPRAGLSPETSVAYELLLPSTVGGIGGGIGGGTDATAPLPPRKKT